MNQFTPGPWRVANGSETGECGPFIMGNVANGPGVSAWGTVARPHGISEREKYANADLIAAAPDLLELVKLMQVRLFVHDGNSELYNQASEAIAKATGQSVEVES